MNKKELAAGVAQRCGMSQTDAASAVDAALDLIAEGLKAGDEVRLMGFGTFSVTVRAAREGRNPQTGAAIQIKESRQPKFKAGKGLTDSLNA